VVKVVPVERGTGGGSGGGSSAATAGPEYFVMIPKASVLRLSAERLGQLKADLLEVIHVLLMNQGLRESTIDPLLKISRTYDLGIKYFDESKLWDGRSWQEWEYIRDDASARELFAKLGGFQCSSSEY